MHARDISGGRVNLRVRVPTGGSEGIERDGGIYVQNSPKVTRFNLYGIL